MNNISLDCILKHIGLKINPHVVRLLLALVWPGFIFMTAYLYVKYKISKSLKK